MLIFIIRKELEVQRLIILYLLFSIFFIQEKNRRQKRSNKKVTTKHGKVEAEKKEKKELDNAHGRERLHGRKNGCGDFAR